MRFDTTDEARGVEMLAIAYLVSVPVGSGDPVDLRWVRDLRDQAQAFQLSHFASGSATDAASSPVMVTASDYAARHGLPRQTVARWCRQGRLAATRSGRTWVLAADAEVGPRGRQSSLPRGSTGGEG